MKNIFNHKKYVGCTVYDDILGELVILNTTNYNPDRYVLLEDKEGTRFCFRKDGIREGYVSPTLRWQPKEVEFDYGEPPWVADWYNCEQRKHEVAYNHRTGEWATNCRYTLQNPGITYMSEYEAQKLCNFNNKNNIKP